MQSDNIKERFVISRQVDLGSGWVTFMTYGTSESARDALVAFGRHVADDDIVINEIYKEANR